MIFDAFDDSYYRPRAFARDFRSGDLREENGKSESVLILLGKRIVIVGTAKDIVVAQMNHRGRQRGVLEMGGLQKVRMMIAF